MNFILTLIYMYFMLTMVYPVVSISLGINNRNGLAIFLIVSFLSISLFTIFYYQKKIDFSEIFDKTIFNSLIVFTSAGVIEDLIDVNFTNLLMKYLQNLAKNTLSKNIVILLPLLFVHISRALLKPY